MMGFSWRPACHDLRVSAGAYVNGCRAITVRWAWVLPS